MVCPVCGCDNKKQAKFCNECGAFLVEVTPAGTPAVTVPEITRVNVKPAGKSTSSDFDFSPIDDEFDIYKPTPAEVPDDRLVDANYRSPKPNWKRGDTVELPPVEDKTKTKQKTYKASETVEPGEKKPLKKSVIIALSAIIVVALLGLGAYALVTKGGFPFDLFGGKPLPDVVGLSKEEATTLLEEEGFMVRIMYVKSDDVENRVLLMDPSANSRLSEGSEVVLQVATPRIIPVVVGLSEEEARQAFKEEGFEKVSYVKEKSNQPEGTVLAVNPPAGEKTKKTTAITVTIAESFKVLDVVGKSAAEAEAALVEEGYLVAIVYEYSDQPEGTVLSSNPAAGTKLNSGETVTISVAKSRATELVAATQNYLANASQISVGGTSYELVKPSDGQYSVSYQSGNVTTAKVTVRGFTTLPDGEVVWGSAKERTITFTWNDDNTLASLD